MKTVNANQLCRSARVWLLLCGIRFRVSVRVWVRFRFKVKVRVRLKVRLGLHAFDRHLYTAG